MTNKAAKSAALFFYEIYKNFFRKTLAFFYIWVYTDIDKRGKANKKGSKRPTVDSFAKDHPNGSYILSVANHVVAVVDGKYYDTWDSGYKSLYGYYEKTGDLQKQEVKKHPERLTKWNGKKWILPQGKNQNGESYWRIIADRLAAYENNGLTQDEIENLKRM